MISNQRSPFGSLRLFALAIALIVPVRAHAQTNAESRAMNQPVPPFHIIGNIYYVGASDIASYLIVTPAGDILLDGGFIETARQIEANIQTLGFKPADVKILLNSHEHADHAGGLAELKRLTGAQLVAMAEEVPTLESGASFPAVTPDRIIHDGDTVELGGVTMTAHLTPGHTRGCTTVADGTAFCGSCGRPMVGYSVGQSPSAVPAVSQAAAVGGVSAAGATVFGAFGCASWLRL